MAEFGIRVPLVNGGQIGGMPNRERFSRTGAARHKVKTVRKTMAVFIVLLLVES